MVLVMIMMQAYIGVSDDGAGVANCIGLDVHDLLRV